MDKKYVNNEWRSPYGRKMIRENLFYTLVGRERNKELLMDVPHVNFLDLAIVFNYMISARDGRIQSFKVNNIIMQTWGIDTQTMYDIARKNMDRLLPETMTCISSIINGFAGGCEQDIIISEEDDVHMYVITNKYAVNGSAAILYSKKLSNIAEMMNSDMYIMPSSIHEMIIVPKIYYNNEDRLKELVKEVNRDVVVPEEQLSDNVYCYDWKSGNIYICENKEKDGE